MTKTRTTKHYEAPFSREAFDVYHAVGRHLSDGRTTWLVTAIEHNPQTVSVTLTDWAYMSGKAWGSLLDGPDRNLWGTTERLESLGFKEAD